MGASIAPLRVGRNDKDPSYSAKWWHAPDGTCAVAQRHSPLLNSPPHLYGSAVRHSRVVAAAALLVCAGTGSGRAALVSSTAEIAVDAPGGVQLNPAAAALPDGGFVVVRENVRGGNLRMQRFDAQGARAPQGGVGAATRGDACAAAPGYFMAPLRGSELNSRNVLLEYRPHCYSTPHLA